MYARLQQHLTDIESGTAAKISKEEDKETPGKRKRKRAPNPLYPPVPTRIMSFGSTNTGKTYTLLNSLILPKDSPWDRTIWIAPEHSLAQPQIEAVARRLKKRFVRLEGDTKVGLTEENAAKLEDLVGRGFDKGLQQLVVVDDCMGARCNPALTSLFVSGRHRNVSCAELSQRVFGSSDAGSRTRRLNADQFFLHHLGGTGQVADLARQLDSSNWREVTHAYKEAVLGKPQGSYFLIDNVAGRSTDARTRRLKYRDSHLARVVEGIPE